MAAKAAKVAVPADARLVVTFYPPDNRRRDTDNMLASIKVGLDGIAAASGVDDRGWTFDLRRGHVVRGGLVTVEVDRGWQSVGDVAARVVGVVRDA